MKFRGCCARLHPREQHNQPEPHPHSQPLLSEAEEEFPDLGVLFGSAGPQPCH